MKLFLIDNEKEYYYDNLFDIIINDKNIYKVAILKQEECYGLFYKILHSLFYEYPISVLDFTLAEGYSSSNVNNAIEKSKNIKSRFSAFDEFIKQLINRTINWEVTLLTSGTTGRPKEITHNINSITRNCRVNDKHYDDIWALAYNPAHIAGIQVFFQALMNQNTIVNVFGSFSKLFSYLYEKYNINRISATPTYYKTLLSFNDNVYYRIKSVACGGEKSSEAIFNLLKRRFPNAKIFNIYASTEAGTLFQSEDDKFIVPDSYMPFIKISENSELCIHKTILAKSDSFNIQDDWYYTGDLVERLSGNSFKFIGRVNSFINVGGYKVNPEYIEEIINKIEFVNECRVYGVKNSVIGNIVCADIIIKPNSELSLDKAKNSIQQYLKSVLNKYEVPRVINIVSEIKMTITSKKARI